MPTRQLQATAAAVGALVLVVYAVRTHVIAVDLAADAAKARAEAEIQIASLEEKVAEAQKELLSAREFAGRRRSRRASHGPDPDDEVQHESDTDRRKQDEADRERQLEELRAGLEEERERADAAERRLRRRGSGGGDGGGDDLRAELEEERRRADAAERKLRMRGSDDDSDKLRAELEAERRRAAAAEAKLQRGGGEDLREELEAERRRADAAERKLRRRAEGRPQGGSELPDRGAVDALADRWGGSVVAPDCGSWRHSDVEPLLMVRPERLPAWAKRYRPGDTDPRSTESDEDRRRSFDMIAKTGSWSKKNPSGTGSEKGEATVRVIRVLERIIPELLRVSGRRRLRMVDVPCGDMTWMPEILEKFSDSVDYTGVDIVERLIEKHSSRFADTPHVRFLRRDVVAHGLPPGEFDLVFSRHMLQHLSTGDAMRVLSAVLGAAERQSGRGGIHLLTTTYPDWQAHVDLDVRSNTRVRKLNLQQPPIALPQPLCWAHDFSFSFVGLWHLPSKLGEGSELRVARAASAEADDSDSQEGGRLGGGEDVQRDGDSDDGDDQYSTQRQRRRHLRHGYASDESAD